MTIRSSKECAEEVRTYRATSVHLLWMAITCLVAQYIGNWLVIIVCVASIVLLRLCAADALHEQDVAERRERRKKPEPSAVYRRAREDPRPGRYPDPLVIDVVAETVRDA